MSTYPRRGLQRILAGSVDPVLRVVLYDQDGEPATAGTITVAVERIDGTEVLPAGSAATAGETGAYTAQLTTDHAAYTDVLKATWTNAAGDVRAVTYHRIVGGFLVNRAELRTRDGLGDATEFDNSLLDAARFAIEDLVEDRSDVAWTPRYDVETVLVERDTGTIVLKHRPVRSIRWITIDGVTQTVSDFDVNLETGVIKMWGDYFVYASVVEIGVEHGFDAPPADLKRAILTAARDVLLADTNRIALRARQVSGGDGSTIDMGWAGPGHPTGIGLVDEALAAHNHHTPSIG